MNRILSALGALLLAAAIVGEADAAGLFSSYPNSTNPGTVSGNGNTGSGGSTITGTECIPADTYLSQGQNAQTECISPSQLFNFGGTTVVDTAYSNVPIGSVAYSSFGNNTTVSTSTTYITQINIPTSFTITNINCLFGTTGNGNANFAIYNAAGTSLLAKGASTATASNNTFQTIALTAPLAVARGRYWIAAQASNASDTIHTIAASTFINTLTTSVTGGVYNTFPASFTIPTTVTANVGPICYVN